MKKLDAFSLVELSIALVIIGFIVGAVFKGSYLIESAKVQATVKQLQELRQNVDLYFHRYGALPGDDNKAQERFEAENGDGSGTFTTLTKAKLAWNHLGKSGIAHTNALVSSKFGGQYVLETIDTNLYLTLGLPEENLPPTKGVLSPDQAKDIKRSLTQSDSDLANEGDVRIRGCVEGDRIKKDSPQKCVLSYRVS